MQGTRSPQGVDKVWGAGDSVPCWGLGQSPKLPRRSVFQARDASAQLGRRCGSLHNHGVCRQSELDRVPRARCPCASLRQPLPGFGAKPQAPAPQRIPSESRAGRWAGAALCRMMEIVDSLRLPQNSPLKTEQKCLPRSPCPQKSKLRSYILLGGEVFRCRAQAVDSVSATAPRLAARRRSLPILRFCFRMRAR